MLNALRSLTVDGRLLFATRFVRLFAYGALSVVLVLYLVDLGLTESATGLLLTMTLLGDTLVSLYLTTRADRFGRRRMLVAGAVLMAAAGVAFAFTHRFWLLVVAGTIGVISPSGQEVGPFLSIEQAALSQVVPARSRTDVFAWYTLAGSVATALGALAAGLLTSSLQHSWAPVDSYRAVVVAYAGLGAALCGLFLKASDRVEAPRTDRGPRHSRRSRVCPGCTSHKASCSGSPASSRWIHLGAGSSSRALRPTGSTCGLAWTRRRWARCSSPPTCSPDCRRWSPRASRTASAS